MLRQVRRRIQRFWDSILGIADCVRGDCGKCVKRSCYCSDFVEGLPNTAVDFQLKVSEFLLLEYNLDMFQRWRLYPVVIVDGFPFRGLVYVVGVASDEWLDEHFGESDDDFEGF